jgi:hypothetical protein
MIPSLPPTPFGLSLSKALLSSSGTRGEGGGFDKLSPNGDPVAWGRR